MITSRQIDYGLQIKGFSNLYFTRLERNAAEIPSFQCLWHRIKRRLCMKLSEDLLAFLVPQQYRVFHRPASGGQISELTINRTCPCSYIPLPMGYRIELTARTG